MNQPNNNEAIYVGTHDGEFHLCDTATLAILSLVFEDKLFIFRSTNEQILKICDIFVEVGNNENYNKGLTGDKVRQNGIPYSCCGIAWKKYGKIILEKCSLISFLIAPCFETIDKKIIQPVDMVAQGKEVKTRFDKIYKLNLIHPKRDSVLYDYYMECAANSAIQDVRKELKHIIKKEYALAYKNRERRIYNR